MQEQQKKCKPWALAALAVLLVALAVGGTYAWLTASNKVTNTFTVGQITKPNPGPTNPDKPVDPVNPQKPLPDPNKPDGNAHLSGNIYELYTQNSTIIPGASIAKRPFIGLGKGSQDSWVFAYVDNQMMRQGAEAGNSAYFTLGAGWQAVEGQTTQYKGEAGKYTGGLFVWCGDAGKATPLAGNELKASWTKPLFDSVVIPNTANASDFKASAKMDVWCYLYAAAGAAETDVVPAQQEAIKWVANKVEIDGQAAAK